MQVDKFCGWLEIIAPSQFHVALMSRVNSCSPRKPGRDPCSFPPTRVYLHPAGQKQQPSRVWDCKSSKMARTSVLGKRKAAGKKQRLQCHPPKKLSTYCSQQTFLVLPSLRGNGGRWTRLTTTKTSTQRSCKMQTQMKMRMKIHRISTNLRDHAQVQRFLRESIVLVRSMAPNESRCHRPKPTARKRTLRLQVRVSSQWIRIILILCLEAVEREQFATPSTQRYKNIFAQFAKPTTPASTPKSRVQAATKLPSTPRTPRTPRSSSNVYNCARQLFARSTTTGHLIGRETERLKLDDFLREGLNSKSGRCLYVSGPPGTGKSAFVGEVCNQFSDCGDAQVTYVNCMSINSAKEIYERLAVEVCGEVPTGSGAAAAALRAKFFSDRDSTVHIVTLDEIDHLLTFDLSCLYTIFEWALNPKSRLLLIGIANALDFTDRFLPRLKARSLKPQLLPFAPYTVSEIDSVITTKLRSLLPSNSLPTTDLPFLHPAAIKLLARKVTAQTGDLRKAFDIVRGTIDLIEAKARADALGLSGQAPPTPPASSPLSENTKISSTPTT